MKKTTILFSAILFLLFLWGSAHGFSIYVDSAPNAFGSPDYPAWEAQAFSGVADGTYVNMGNRVNPANAGTTNFEIEDEVVYSFGDLGRRLTWIYWIPDATIDDLAGNFEISLFNIWDGQELDFYEYYYGSTWVEPTNWTAYEGGVIGTAGMAWWGAFGYTEGTPEAYEALNADIAEWGLAEEYWVFTARLNQEEIFSITSHRAPIPEPSTLVLLGIGGLGFLLFSRKRLGKKR